MSRQVRVASLIWAASILLSRLIGLVREAVLGRTLGASSAADVYASAFTVPDFLNYLLAGGALSIVFIPIYGAYLARGETERGSQAFSVIANVLCLALGVLTVSLWLAMPSLAPLVAPGFDDAERAELVHLARIMLPAQLFHVVGGLLAAAQQARDKHALAALAPLVYTLGIIGGGLLMQSAEGFAWGVLVGSLAGPFALPLYGAWKSGLRWTPTLAWRHPDLRTYLVRSLPIMIGFSIVVVDDWYLKREGSLVGEGAAASLAYAKTLMKVPIGVFGLAAGVGAFPTLQRLVAEGQLAQMRAMLGSTLRTVLVLSFLAQALLTVCGVEIVTLVYGRARLSAPQIESIAASLAWVSIGLSAWAAQPLLARGFYALGNTWLPALLGTLVAALAYPLYVLGREARGLEGLALASALAICAYVVALALCFARAMRAPNLGATAAALFLLRVGLAALVAIGVGKLARGMLPESSAMLDVVLRLATAGAASVCAFAAVAAAVGLPEVHRATDWLRTKLRAR